MENNNVVLNETELEENYTVVDEQEDETTNYGGLVLIGAGVIAGVTAAYFAGKKIVEKIENSDFAKKRKIKKAMKMLNKSEAYATKGKALLESVTTETTEEKESE